MPLYTAPRISILGASAVAVSGPADTNENILATVTIPAGAMGLNGILRVYHAWTVTSSGNNKILRVRFGGIGGTGFATNTLTTSVSAVGITHIANRGVANSQVGPSNASSIFQGVTSGTGNALTTSSIDTSAATTLVLTGQKASAGETLTLESYLCELILP